ncbi:MAG: glutaminase A [Synechococcaceae cyanobacterium]|nr:glutaminase A [Synechococcaceae cyanobacterium]
MLNPRAWDPRFTPDLSPFVDRLAALFSSLSESGVTSAATLQRRLLATGIQPDDFRLQQTWKGLDEWGDRPIDLEAFRQLISAELLMVTRVLNHQLIVPEWEEFQRDIRFLYDQVASDRSGANADYIPILRDADPERWGVAVCTVDGQRLALGDVDDYHSIQSVSKPITYAFALAQEGAEFTHQFVGVEPSGRPFNALELLPDMRPYNPCVNAGAIMIAGLVASGFPDRESRGITQELIELWADLCGHGSPVRFSEETMLSERATADNNFAIAYLLQGRHGLPRGVDLHKMLDVYFSCCSIEMTARMLSVAAATLANGGVCPISGRPVLSTDIVKRTLSVMQSAGMYDSAGSFTLEVGLPAKSGVAGSVLVVIPNLMGFATFSPRLDSYGNSVRGVSFCRQLVERFSVHVYDNLSGGHSGCKRDPRVSRKQRKQADLSDLRWGISHGDRSALRVRDLILACLIDISLADGELESQEIEVMNRIYAELIGEPPAQGALEKLAQQRSSEPAAQVAKPVDGARAGSGSAFDRLLLELSAQSGQIDDQAREIILETAFQVACSDGTLENEEQEKLRAIARALGIGEGVLELEINAFQRARQSQLA